MCARELRRSIDCCCQASRAPTTSDEAPRLRPYPEDVPDPDAAATSIPIDARRAILDWYAERGRPLAFRRTRDPYAVLVSEAMAQQTQAARAAEAWERFLVRFPTVFVLAAAAPADVLRQWAGLGYDRRALALWRAARILVEEHGGQVPDDLEALQALPGVGPYTARAVAALAFGQPVGAVDVNVRRVVGRVVAGDATLLTAGEMQAVADSSVPPEDPGGWTHAVMDIGATVCRPRRPRCEACPARPWCRFAMAPPLPPTPGVARSRAARERPVPFESTNRWLRGRIMTSLRAEQGPDWVRVEETIGVHARPAIEAALAGLERDGLIERDGEGRARLRAT
jgi:A/G-specific adenine glycosylase